MRYRFPLVLFFTLSVFTCNSIAQTISAIPTITTADNVQITVSDPNDNVKKISLEDLSDRSRGSAEGYVEFNAKAKTYFINIDLGMGPTKDLYIHIYRKDGTVLSQQINVERVAPDSKPKKSSSTIVPSSLQKDTNIASSTNESRNDIASTVGPIVAPPQVTSEYFVGGSPSSRVPLPILTESTAVPVSRGSVAPFPVAFATSVKPAPAPTPSDKQKALDAEDPNIPINPNLRLIFGFEQAGGSSAKTSGRPFVDLLAFIPVGQFGVNYNKRNKATRRFFKNSFWTSLKLTSAPNQTLPDFGGLTSGGISTFFGGNSSSQVNDLVQAFETQIGWETTVRSNLGLIFGVGATSPLTAEKTAIAYNIPRLADGTVRPEFKQIFGPNQDFTDIENLILTSGDRDRFMRNWFLGFRLRHQITGTPEEVYPAMFELTVGQDEVLTNKLIGNVLKFNSFIPIRVKGLNFLYFGTSFSAKLTRKVNTTTFPFFLEPSTNLDLYGPSNFVRNFRDIRELNSDRDIFAFRIGVDLTRLINRKDKTTDEAVKKTFPVPSRVGF